MFLLSDQDLDRRAETEDREPPLSAAQIRSAAEDRLLADTDEYTNWLVGHCANVSYRHTRIGSVPNDPARLQMFVDTLDVPQLVAASIDSNTALRALAGWMLRERFKAENAHLVAKFVDEVEA